MKLIIPLKRILQARRIAERRKNRFWVEKSIYGVGWAALSTMHYGPPVTTRKSNRMI